MLSTHQQQPDQAIDRDLVKRLADLCRADPALWSRVVRYSDELERQGVESGEATRRALELAGW